MCKQSRGQATKIGDLRNTKHFLTNKVDELINEVAKLKEKVEEQNDRVMEMFREKEAMRFENVQLRDRVEEQRVSAVLHCQKIDRLQEETKTKQATLDSRWREVKALKAEIENFDRCNVEVYKQLRIAKEQYEPLELRCTRLALEKQELLSKVEAKDKVEDKVEDRLATLEDKVQWLYGDQLINRKGIM